jgi:hypothetical protein
MLTDRLQQFYECKNVTALCPVAGYNLALITPYLSAMMRDTSPGGTWFDLFWGTICLTQIFVHYLSHCRQISGMHLKEVIISSFEILSSLLYHDPRI